jgi:hypothetical protein
LTDGPSRLETTGTLLGYAASPLFVALGVWLLVNQRSARDLIPAILGIGLGLVLSYITPISTMQLRHRRRLLRELAATGVRTSGEVVDRWRFNIAHGTAGGVRVRYVTDIGSLEAVACDSIDLIRRIRVGDALSLVYDPLDPKRVVIEEPKGLSSNPRG